MRAGLHPVLVAALSLCGALAATSSATASDALSIARAVLDEVGASRTDCPAASVPFAADPLCVEFRPTLYALRDAWDELLDRAFAAEVRPLGDWVMGCGTCLFRDYRVGEGGMRMTLDFRSAMARVTPLQAAEATTPWGPPEAGVVWSRKPKLPKVAKKARVTGQVVMDAVIDSDGRARDLRLLWACPIGFGLVQAAAESVESWRFEPGTGDDTRRTVLVDFSLDLRKGKAPDLAPDRADPVLRCDSECAADAEALVHGNRATGAPRLY